MYSLKVKSSGTLNKNKYSAVAAGTLQPSANSPEACENDSHEFDLVSFSAGNPRVEHITGVVHLYRHIPDADSIESSFDAVDMSTTDHDDQVVLPKHRGRDLCVLSIPPDMGFAEFCTFLSGYFENVKEIRLVRREGSSKSSSCLVLLHFDKQEAADGFYKEFNAKPFCVLEPDLLCRLLFVKEIEITDASTTNTTTTTKTQSSHIHTHTHTTNTNTASPTLMKELPSCPVCLERLDESISGIVTTVCNHRFHNQCLRQWVDASCPVCRYCQHSEEHASHCTSCGTSSDLWICLICGHIGCGRYRGSHAADHWQSTGHGYALELETQRVWDYSNDAYVHRHVRSKVDGMLVEVTAPAVVKSRRQSGGVVVEGDNGDEIGYYNEEEEDNDSGYHGGVYGDDTNDNDNDDGAIAAHMHHHHHYHEYNNNNDDETTTNTNTNTNASRKKKWNSTKKLVPAVDACCSKDAYVADPEMHEALVVSKLDALTTEYSHLLVSQMESQRFYFENLLLRSQKEAETIISEAMAKAAVAVEASVAADNAATDAERRKRQVESKLVDVTAKLQKATEEKEFLKDLNTTLLANQKAFKEKLSAAETMIAAKDAQLKDMEEQVRDLMVFIEARETIEAQGGASGDGVEGGTLLPLPPQQKKRAVRKNRR